MAPGDTYSGGVSTDPTASTPPGATERYHGELLGMPPAGPGSMAPLGRRVIGVVIDWLLCQLIAVALLGSGWGQSGSGLAVLGVFALENLVLVATTGGTVGHHLMRLQVRQAREGFYPMQVAVRTALLCLFLPALFTDGDGRGMHDRAAGTVIVRR